MNDAQTLALVTFIAHFITSAHVSGFVSYTIEKMKNSKSFVFRWIDHNTPWVSRMVAGVGAVLTAGGVSWTFDHSTGIATISGLSAMGILTALYHVAENFLIQHGWYKSVFQTEPPATPPLPLVNAPVPSKK